MPYERLRGKDDQLTDVKKKSLRSLSGQLLWVTSQTRPDCSFDSYCVSNYGKLLTVRNIVDAVKKLTSKKLRLVFPENLKIIVYGDATHVSLPTGDSQGAHIVFFNGNATLAPVTWRSKKLDRVIKSYEIVL